MVSTYTTRNKHEKQAPGENTNTWGGILNNTIDLTDVSLDGIVTVNLSAGNVTLTNGNAVSNQARYRMLRLEGSITTGKDLILPDAEKWYLIDNALSTSAANVTIRNTSDITGIDISTGTGNLIVMCDGTSTRDGFKIGDDVMQGSQNFKELTNVSAALSVLGITSVGTGSASSFQDQYWPVGTIYMNYNTATNPGTLLQFGTWVSIAAGRLLIGAGTGTDINTVTSSFSAVNTGGEYYHTMTSAELVQHDHLVWFNTNNMNELGGTKVVAMLFSETDSGSATSSVESEKIGGTVPFNTQQPYLVVHMWRRSA